MTAPADGLLLEGRDLGLRLRGVTVLDQVDITISAGQQLALGGRSGSGKTSLLMLLSGLLAPTTGTLTRAAADARSRSAVGMVFQAPSLVQELTARENVMLPLRLRGVDVAGARAAGDRAMARLSVAEVADALPGQLSGGQLQRVAVARVLALAPRLILADEPTGALDRANAMAVVTALRDDAAAAGGALVLATHDEEIAELFGDRRTMSEGRIDAMTRQ